MINEVAVPVHSQSYKERQASISAEMHDLTARKRGYRSTMALKFPQSFRKLSGHTSLHLVPYE
jgi:pyoverdine/dityrosine biosynthesis protein Dit1